MRMREPIVVVIGAGVAGLTCARELARRQVPNVVLERSRSVGGRCATRWIEGQPVDFGLPLLHATSREFGLELNQLDESGKVVGWPLRVREPRLACQPDAYRPGNRRLGRSAGVNEFARALAAELDIRQRVHVTTLESAGPSVRVLTRDGERFEAPFVVLATELSETLRLAPPLVAGWPGAAPLLERLRALRAVRTLTVIAGYPKSIPDPGFDIWYPLESTMVHTIVNDSSKRADSPHRVLVIQGREVFSNESYARTDDEWAHDLLWEAGELLGAWVERPLWRQTHRWHCARLRRGQSLGDVVNFESPDGACVALCGDAFAVQTGLEAAYMSGIALGEQIGTLPRVRERVREMSAG